METGFESWFQNQQIDPNLSGAPFGYQHRLNVPHLRNMFSLNITNVNLPLFAFSASKPQEPCDWFCGLTPMVNSIPKEKLPQPRVTQVVEKKFLVFDKSNDQTTLIYSSTPAQYQIIKPHVFYNLKKESSVTEKHANTHFKYLFLDDENNVVSEMREDSEELKALLYSDDDEADYYSEDGEEQSTGYSPDLIIGLNKHEWQDDYPEEVASSMGCRKKQKLALEDTASSGKSGINHSSESELCSCRNNSGARNGVSDVESETFPAVKRARKEKVRETIKILKNLIPGGKSGKDAMLILDEAINYLRILKVKAMALGLYSLYEKKSNER